MTCLATLTDWHILAIVGVVLFVGVAIGYAVRGERGY
jgi:hypothetical protein